MPEQAVVTLLPIHIAAGGLAMILGATALLVSKGRWLHRRVGIVFVAAMVVMGVSGSILAMRHSFTNANVLGGFVSAYFVVTALTTVRPDSTWVRQTNAVAFVVAVMLVLVQVGLGIRALGHSNAENLADGVPFFGVPLLLMATIIALAAVGDSRLLRSGALQGRARVARHLWRMCFALFIAAGSFFSIPERVAKILPDALAMSPLRLLPIALVFVAMFYWLWRVRRRLPVRQG